MATLPEFELPSDPNKTVHLREATVSDAIDFSEVKRECEEEATTLFLQRLQEKDKYSDPRLWTMEDRRFALFWYTLHTTKETDFPLIFDCEDCTTDPEKPIRHTVFVKYADIMDEYSPIEGKPVRDVIHDGHAILVHPILGKDAELLEKSRLNIMYKEQEGQNTSKERTQLMLLELLCRIDIVGLAPDVSPDERRPKVEEYLTKMRVSEFQEFYPKLLNAAQSLQHGLRSKIVDGEIKLESPVVYCPNDTDKARGIRLHYPFRAFQHIPVIQ